MKRDRNLLDHCVVIFCWLFMLALVICLLAIGFRWHTLP